MAKKTSDKAKYTKQRVDAVNKLGTESKKKTKKTANTLDSIDAKLEKRGKGKAVSANQMNYAGKEMTKGTIYDSKKAAKPTAKKAKIAYQTKETPTKAVKAKK